MILNRYVDGILSLPGASGYSGLSGYSGSAGGATGSSGYSGYSGKSGYSGYSAQSGYSGISGETGPQGPQGLFGGDSMPYLFKAITSGDPSSGGLLLNSSTYSSATALTMNQYNLDLVIISAWHTAISTSGNNPKGVIRIFKLNDSSVFVDFYIVPGLVAVAPGNAGFAIQYITGNGTFNDFDYVVVSWSKAGNSGTSGTSGYSGYIGTSGYSGYSGISGYSGYSGLGVSGFSGYSGMFGGDSMPYIIDVSTSPTGAITAGYVLTNGEADPTNISNLIFSKTNQDGIDVSTWLDALDDSTTTTNRGNIRLVNRDDSSVFADFTIISSTFNATYQGYIVVVSLNTYYGASLTHNKKMIASFSRTGDKGTSGFSGYSGVSGYSGYSGKSGYSGYSATGTSGFSGYSGANGTGATGSSGFSGYSGGTGPSGSNGSSGFSGYSGAGSSGFSGYSGNSTSGFSGYSGISGYSGYSGKSGYSGYSGTGNSGFSGYSGQPGSTGIATSGFSGYSGISGYSGYSGISGYSGYSGKSGYSGYSATGSSGFSGYSGSSSGSEQTASISSNQNDYSFTTGVTLLRLSADADGRRITGLAGGGAGKSLRIENVGTKEIIFTHQDSGSTAANRIICPFNVHFCLRPNDIYTFVYDNTTARWILDRNCVRDFLSDPAYCLVINDDFYTGTVSSTTLGLYGWAFSGAGTVARDVSVEPGRFGAMYFSGNSGQDKALHAQSGNTLSTLVNNSEQYVLTTAVKLPTNISDATNDYYVAVGMGDLLGTTLATYSNGDDTGIMFEYDYNVSTNWIAYTGSLSAGSSAQNSTGVTAAADTWIQLQAVYRPADTVAYFYVNGSLTNTITTGLPTPGGTDAFGPTFYYYRRAGSAATRWAHWDYIKWMIIRTTARVGGSGGGISP